MHVNHMHVQMKKCMTSSYITGFHPCFYTQVIQLHEPKQKLNVVDVLDMQFLNQAHVGLQPMHVWFLEFISSVKVGIFVCVCPRGH